MQKCLLLRQLQFNMPIYYLAILLPCFVDLFWGVTLAIRVRRNLRPQNIWIALLVVSATLSFIWASSITGGPGGMPYALEIVEGFAILLYFPLIYLYFRSLTDERPLGWRDYLWLLPALLVGGANMGLYLTVGGPEAPELLSRLAHEGTAALKAEAPGQRMLYFVGVTLINLVARVQMVWVMIYAALRYMRYRRRLDEFFSNPEGKSLENNRATIICLFIMLSISIIFSVGRYYYTDHKALGILLMSLTGIVAYILDYNVASLHYTASDLAREQRQGDAEALSEGYAGQANPKMQALGEEFERLLDEEHIFLQSDLRLDDVARMMRTNRAYISRMINERFGCSFSTLVNSRRIARAQELMKAQPELKTEQLAESSGFANATYFSTTFRRQTGQTSREWRRKNGIL